MRLLLDHIWIIMNKFVCRIGFYLTRRISDNDLNALYIKLSPSRIKNPLVRIGGESDGGYVLVDSLSNVEAVFSAGVGQISAFEKFFLERGINCYLADATVVSPTISHPQITFERILIGSESHGIPYVSLDNWVKRHKPGNSTNLLLQMDIEGSEYETLALSSEIVLKRFSQIVVEFHNFSDILSPMGYKLFMSLLDKILLNHVIIHVHANNCCPPIKVGDKSWPSVVEVTFARIDTIDILYKPDWSGLDLPIDSPNNPKNKWKYW